MFELGILQNWSNNEIAIITISDFLRFEIIIIKMWQQTINTEVCSFGTSATSAWTRALIGVQEDGWQRDGGWGWSGSGQMGSRKEGKTFLLTFPTSISQQTALLNTDPSHSFTPAFPVAFCSKERADVPSFMWYVAGRMGSYFRYADDLALEMAFKTWVRSGLHGWRFCQIRISLLTKVISKVIL